MILHYEDLIDKLAEKHPQVERRSLENIAKKGLFGINKLMRIGQELLIQNFFHNGAQDDWIKFYINMSPKEQNNHAMRNYYRKLKRKELNGSKQSNVE